MGYGCYMSLFDGGHIVGDSLSRPYTLWIPRIEFLIDTFIQIIWIFNCLDEILLFIIISTLNHT